MQKVKSKIVLDKDTLGKFKQKEGGVQAYKSDTNFQTKTLQGAKVHFF